MTVPRCGGRRPDAWPGPPAGPPSAAPAAAVWSPRRQNLIGGPTGFSVQVCAFAVSLAAQYWIAPCRAVLRFCVLLYIQPHRYRNIRAIDWYLCVTRKVPKSIQFLLILMLKPATSPLQVIDRELNAYSCTNQINELDAECIRIIFGSNSWSIADFSVAKNICNHFTGSSVCIVLFLCLFQPNKSKNSLAKPDYCRQTMPWPFPAHARLPCRIALNRALHGRRRGGRHDRRRRR